MMRRVAAPSSSSLMPPWLEPLLTTHFFTTCSVHPDAARSECNMYCLDCPSSSSFCFYCRSEAHDGHRVVQIRRSSYHDVVRAAEIQKVLDIGGVQTYVINSARVLFLNERPQPRQQAGGGGGGGGSGGSKVASSQHACEICARSLLDPFRFCSLGCKLVGIKRKGDACFLLGGGDQEEEEAAAASGGSGGYGGGGGEGNVTGGLPERGGRAENDVRLSSTPPPQHVSRRRKGIPHRAPFYS